MWKPIEYTDALRKHWGAIVTSGAVIGALGIWQGLGHLVPRSVYWTVIFVGLAAASYKVWLAENLKCENAEADLERERSLHGGPEISFAWGAFPPQNTRKTLLIENSSSTDAYEVKVSDLGLNRDACAATFPVMPKCPRGSREILKFELIGKSVPSTCKDDLEMVVYASGGAFPKDDRGNDIVDFPFSVVYEEYGGAKYEASFRFLADTYMQSVTIHRVSRKRIN